MLGSTASNALMVSWRALFSASDDCQPESFAEPVMDVSRLAAADPPAAALAPTLVAVLGAALPAELPPGAAEVPPPAEGRGVAPPLHAPAISAIVAPRVNRLRRIGVLLREARGGPAREPRDVGPFLCADGRDTAGGKASEVRFRKVSVPLQQSVAGARGVRSLARVPRSGGPATGPARAPAAGAVGAARAAQSSSRATSLIRRRRNARSGSFSVSSSACRYAAAASSRRPM